MSVYFGYVSLLIFDPSVLLELVLRQHHSVTNVVFEWLEARAEIGW